MKQTNPGEVVKIEEFWKPKKPTREEEGGGGGRVRVVTWNIERGYQIEGIIREMKDVIDADVMCIQEVDIGCERSRGVDCLREIASKLGMNCCFVSEFNEEWSPDRSKRDQGGGVHGNAIFSRYPMRDVRVIRHSEQPVKWEVEGKKIGEPRTGERFAIRSDIEIPGWKNPLRIWCAHLEVFCGIKSRISQFSDILRDSTGGGERGEGGEGTSTSPKQQQVHQIIAGDLNTMAHSIARLSRWYCRDSMRFYTIGQSEPMFWMRNVLQAKISRRTIANPETGGKDEIEINESLRGWGFPESVCRACVNPGFEEVFGEVDRDITLSNHCGLFNAKLDWIMCRGVFAVERNIGNHSFELSDHKWISADVKPF